MVIVSKDDVFTINLNQDTLQLHVTEQECELQQTCRFQTWKVAKFVLLPIQSGNHKYKM